MRPGTAPLAKRRATLAEGAIEGRQGALEANAVLMFSRIPEFNGSEAENSRRGGMNLFERKCN
jgi:hypothetical protein